MQNALSVDLEEYFQVSNFDGVIPRDGWDALPSRVEAATHRLLDLFDASGHRATFFVLGWVAERQGALVRTIAERGHEIACHGFGHQLVYEIGRERFEADLARSQRAIEDACGVAVRGYRAPSYSITERSLWALDVLAEAGFTYDSSIFPIRHHRYGIPAFPQQPVRLALDSGAEILEFPMTTLRAFGTNLPLAGGAYLRFLPLPFFRLAFDHLVRSGRATVLYLHPWEIDGGQPVQDVGFKTRVNHYYNRDQMEQKLAAVIRPHAFGALEDVLQALDDAGRIETRPLAELATADDADALTTAAA